MTITTSSAPFIITPDDVRASINRAKRSLEEAAQEIVWQVEMEGWRTLGYRSWDAMREAEYGGAAFMVPSNKRPKLVARLRATGLTQQEIADTAGVSQRTVSNDLDSSFAKEPVKPARAMGEANTINALANIVRRAFTPTNVATLSPRAKRNLIDLLNQAIETLTEGDSHDD